MEPITSTVPGLTLAPCPHSSPGLFSSLTQRVPFFLRHKKRERARTLKVSTKEPQTPKSHIRRPLAVVSPSLSPSRPLESHQSRHSPVWAKEKSRSTNPDHSQKSVSSTTTPHAEALFSPASQAQASLSPAQSTQLCDSSVSCIFFMLQAPLFG